MTARGDKDGAPDSKQSRSASAVPFDVDMFAESKQPTALRRQSGETTQTVSCLHLEWVISTILWSRLVVTIVSVHTWTHWRDCSVGLQRWSRGQETEYRHLIRFLNPIALLVKSRKEMSPHIGLTAGINRAPPTRCLSHEMNSLLWIAKSLDLMA